MGLKALCSFRTTKTPDTSSQVIARWRVVVRLGWVCGFGGRCRGVAEDFEDGGRHGLVGVGEEEADLPHLGIVELGFEGRHAGEANAVCDFPIRFANRIVADADDVGIVPMWFEQLRGVGIHVVADGGWLAMETVAEGAALNVDAGTRSEVGLIGRHVGADHFLLNACIERDLTSWPRRNWRIGDSNRHIAIGEERQDSERNEDDAEDEPEQESHK